MSQPQNVPTKPVAKQHYESPPRRDRVWNADRPGDVFIQGQPEGELLGSQGPDQGFALRLRRQFEPMIRLASGEYRADVVAGTVAVAMRRASLFGRAPMRDDVELALTIFGFLDADAQSDLVEWREPRFAELSHTAQHYTDARELVSAVPEETLRLSVTDASRAYDRNWRDVLGALPSN